MTSSNGSHAVSWQPGICMDRPPRDNITSYDRNRAQKLWHCQSREVCAVPGDPVGLCWCLTSRTWGLTDSIRQESWAKALRLALLDSTRCSDTVRQYKMVCTGTSQYVPYSIKGRTRNLKMVHTSMYKQVRTKSWQDLAKLEMVKTCLNHVQTCLYLYRNVEPVHMMFVPVCNMYIKICNCTYVLVYMYMYIHGTDMYIFQYSTLFWQHPACKLLLDHCWMHHSSRVRCLLHLTVCCIMFSDKSYT